MLLYPVCHELKALSTFGNKSAKHGKDVTHVLYSKTLQRRNIYQFRTKVMTWKQRAALTFQAPTVTSTP